MKIYIASSWKNKARCLEVTRFLRDHGHEVDCFCDPSTGRYSFHWSELVATEDELKDFDQFRFMNDARTDRAFLEDKRFLEWAEAVVLLLPSGKSAHLEGGFIRGAGKYLFVVGEFPPGEFELMYKLADGIFRYSDLNELLAALERKATK